MYEMCIRDSTAHGLSSKMSRVVVSFHSPGTPRDQVVYFRMGADDKETLGDKMCIRDRLIQLVCLLIFKRLNR